MFMDFCYTYFFIEKKGEVRLFLKENRLRKVVSCELVVNCVERFDSNKSKDIGREEGLGL